MVGLSFLFVLVETRSEYRVSKRGFRTLRSPAQGSALRTRKPFEKGLTESFNMGAVLISLFAATSYTYNQSQSRQTER